MIDIKEASMVELAKEMNDRCKAQKEFFVALWGRPENDVIESLYTGSMTTLIGNLIHTTDVLRRDMIEQSNDVSDEIK